MQKTKDIILIQISSPTFMPNKELLWKLMCKPEQIANPQQNPFKCFDHVKIKVSSAYYKRLVVAVSKEIPLNRLVVVAL